MEHDVLEGWELLTRRDFLLGPTFLVPSRPSSLEAVKNEVVDGFRNWIQAASCVSGVASPH
jgi:hypothetical protein